MSIEVGAVYENGSLKLDSPLPLAEHERVTITVRAESTVARKSYGIMGFTGDVALLRKIATEPEAGVMESP